MNDFEDFLNFDKYLIKVHRGKFAGENHVEFKVYEKCTDSLNNIYYKLIVNDYKNSQTFDLIEILLCSLDKR